MARFASLLLPTLLFLGACAGGEDEAPRTGPWTVARLSASDPTGELPRASFDDESRPLWGRAAQSGVQLPRAADAVLEFEVARVRGTGRPERVEVVFATQGTEVSLATAALAPQEPVVRPWYRFSVDLSPAAGQTGTLRVLVDGVVADADSDWIASSPRVFGERDVESRFNVLFISIDTLRADYLGCYGHDRPTSPAIDALAAQSILFERALSQSSWTLPSYATLLSGLHPETHGVVRRRHRFDGRQVSFVELFAEAGYSTAAFVSGTFTDSRWGFDQGFDLYDDLGMVYGDNDERTGDIDPKSPRFIRKAHQRLTSPEIDERARRWLEEHRDRRFFLFLHYFDPHEEYLEHAEFRADFPVRALPRHLEVKAPEDLTDENRGPFQRRAELSRIYEQEIRFTDGYIGGVLRHLDELGLADNTIVVFHADHGEEFGERIRVGHGHSVFDELIHVPLLMRIPGRAPARLAQPVGTVDIAPTLLELCGLPVPDVSEIEMQGRSLVPLLEDPTLPRGEPVLSTLFTTAADPSGNDMPLVLMFRVEDEDFTLVERGPRKGETGSTAWLFDKAADPHQTTDLSEAERARARRMRRHYQRVRPTLEGLRRTPESMDLTDREDLLRALGYGSEDGEE